MSEDSDVDPATAIPRPCDDNAPDPRYVPVSWEDVRIIAAGVEEAYHAFDHNLPPALPGYGDFELIYAYEARSPSLTGSAADGGHLEPVADAQAPQGTGTDPTPAERAVGSGVKTLFGFAAISIDKTHNLVVFRGTITKDETYYDVSGWGKNVKCYFPSQFFYDRDFYGEVNESLYEFYTEDAGDVLPYTSLAYSSQSAIQKVAKKNPNGRWLLGAHSLGGAMISLAALDGVASASFGKDDQGRSIRPLVVTFGSLHVGIQSFKSIYTNNIPLSYRIANLCDFVPSMVSLEPFTPKPRYCHVGSPGTFVWQKWNDWDNHSMKDTYKTMVDKQEFWNLVQWTKRRYPQ